MRGTSVRLVHVAAFAKIAARLGAIWTLLSAVLVLGWQILLWILTSEWTALSISKSLALANLKVGSSERSGESLNTIHRILDWLLDLPASGFLLAVAVILMAISISAASIEKRFAKTGE